MTANGRKRLVIYLVCEPETPALAEAAVEGGADLVELGFPFSDPLAEGPVIQRASERALGKGMRTAQCLECLAEVRRRVDVPLVPMTYAAILEAYGYERFAADTRAAGATSAIVVDLPVEVHPEVRRVQLVAPTSTDERIRTAAAATDGWLYLVSLTGTTGVFAAGLTGNGNPIYLWQSSVDGSTGWIARQASLPWPISRRLVPPMRPVSPTEYGGKL